MIFKTKIDLNTIQVLISNLVDASRHYKRGRGNDFQNFPVNCPMC
jgi:hypothetical protein